MSKLPPSGAGISKRRALHFVLLLGLVSLFADLTYEGARSIIGPYLAILGASATAVGIVAGLGELIGYGLRLASGYVSDRTERYWAITLAGYGLNLLAVPLLALAGRWEIAALLVIAERTGKALRTPPRDAMLSHATAVVGRGWGFGLHEAMDQVGAMVGPLFVASALYVSGGYRSGFALLLIPALLALAILGATRLYYPSPRDLEVGPPALTTKGLPRSFWLYLVAAALIAVGYADFPLIAFHFQKEAVISAAVIPLFYTLAMGADALAALLCGRLFDRIGLTTLAIVSFLAALFAPLVFLGNAPVALLGTALWGVGVGAQESIMRAAVASMVAADRRGTAYGLFSMGFGVFWFIGSALLGILYDVSLLILVAFSSVMQLASIPLLLAAAKARGQHMPP